MSASTSFAGQELAALAALGIDSRPRKNKPCPACGGKDRFSLFENGRHLCRQCGNGDFLNLIQKVRHCDFRQAFAAVKDAIGSGRTWEAPTLKAPPVTTTLTTPEYIKRIWEQSKPITNGDPVSLYLEGRKLKLALYPQTLRYHPALPYINEQGKKQGSYAAMVAAVQAATGEVVCLHRTYLMKDGTKAPVEPNKKLTKSTAPGALAGAAIRLYKPGSELALAEGIETALSYSQIFGIPSWACLNSWGLEQAVIPPGVTTVHLCIDNDDAGRKAAVKLSERLLRKHGDQSALSALSALSPRYEISKQPITLITNQLPECLRNRKGADWNDVLLQGDFNNDPS